MATASVTSRPAAASPLTATALAAPSSRARVLAVFPTAVYLRLGRHEEVLPVLASDALLLPTGLRLPVASGSLAWGVEPGQDLAVGEGRVVLPGLDLVVVRQWRPARVGAVPRRAPWEAVRHLLRGAGVSHALWELAADLTRAALRGSRVRPHLAGLVGAGRGLTPSRDDMLCGVLLALRAAGPPAAGALASVAAGVRGSLERTTSLSASLLVAAAQGYAVPQATALVTAASAHDPRAVGGALGPALAVGHSSGADLAAGLAGALEVLATVVPPRTVVPPAALVPISARPQTTHPTRPEGARRA